MSKEEFFEYFPTVYLCALDMSSFAKPLPPPEGTIHEEDAPVPSPIADAPVVAPSWDLDAKAIGERVYGAGDRCNALSQRSVAVRSLSDLSHSVRLTGSVS